MLFYDIFGCKIRCHFFLFSRQKERDDRRVLVFGVFCALDLEGEPKRKNVYTTIYEAVIIRSRFEPFSEGTEDDMLLVDVII